MSSKSGAIRMRLMAVLIAALTLNAVAASQSFGGSVERQGQTSYATSESSERVVLENLRPVLIESGYSGRLYYVGKWAEAGSEFVCFPAVKIRPPIGDGLRAIESLFRDDKNVTVSMKASKVVSITIGPASSEVLQTVVPVFRLAPLGRYNPSLAIGALVNNPAMEFELTRRGLHVPLSPSGEILVQPANGRPHLPDAMDGMTADQILTAIAITFRGVVVFGISNGSRTQICDIKFVGLEKASPASVSHQ
jgi:hypothetical protein